MSLPAFGLERSKAPPPVRASLEPIIRFFAYHDAHPIALGMVLMESFGPDWLDWEAEALKKEIVTTFKATSVSDNNWQKIQAFRTMLLATSPWTEWEVFEKVMQALNNNIPDHEVLQCCTIAQLMAGVDMMNQVREEVFSWEVERYIAACAIEGGITYLPAPLAFAQEALASPQYHCRDCGNVDELTQTDMRCDVCSERFCDDRPLNGKPNPDLPPDCGKNIEVYFLRDPSEVEFAFEQMKEKKRLPSEVDQENRVDVQAAKLLVAFRYMRQRQEDLVKQLEELKTWVKH